MYKEIILLRTKRIKKEIDKKELKREIPTYLAKE